MLELVRAVRALPASEWRRAAALAALTTLMCLVFPAAAAAQGSPTGWCSWSGC
jgi:hypothetical protein